MSKVDIICHTMSGEPIRLTTVIANWKMHKTVVETTNYITSLALSAQQLRTRVGVAVPFTMIPAAAQAAKGTPVFIGAQNISEYGDGPYTGEVSAAMVKDAGAYFCVIGHSERRRLFHETDETVNLKVKKALEAGVRPLLCIGETLEERKAGRTESILERQLTQCLAGVGAKEAEHFLIAYEPVWAIGNGTAAKPEDAQKEQRWCRAVLAKLWGESIAESISILYGGSVKPESAELLIQKADVDGFLVGAASLDIEVFMKILQCQKG